ncbi:NUDIX domain-containing protein [Rhodobacteraceae bacterium RKSG542]|nr:NUDIX domain-containing protein [Pseudovibrio flavus]
MTCGSHLLVFSEPDFPEVGLQVPGGTLDPGESYLHGARREFEEETGLELASALHHLADEDFIFEEPHGPDLHRRRFFHTKVNLKPKTAWDHFEMSPNNGAAPILFRFFWLDLNSDMANKEELFYAGFYNQLHQLRRLI